VHPNMTSTPRPLREPPAATLQQALQRHQSGDLLGAEALYRVVLEQDAQHAVAWHLLALVEYQRGNWLSGLEHIRRAIGLNSRVPQFHVNLGNLLKAAGRTQEAVHAYYLAVAMDPAYAEAYNNLGNTYLALRTWGEAEACLRAAVRLEPTNPDALSNLGAALHEQGKLEEAVACLRRALEHRPAFAEGWYNLGNTLMAQGDNEASIEAYRRAVAANSNLMEGWYNLANVLARVDRFEEAGACYQKAILLKPDHVAAIFNFGNVLQAAGCLDESMTCYAEVLRVKPDHAGAHFCWGNALNSKAKPAEAAEHYDLALALDPDMAKAYHMKGGALYNQGRVDEAIRTSLKALELNKDMPLTFSNSLFMLNYEQGVGPEEHLARHREFDTGFCAQAAARTVHMNDRDLHRRLRVGYVSPDLRRHSVAYFIEPVLARHDPAQIEVVCYFNSSLADDVTRRLRGCAAQWVDCYWMSNDELADRIAADRIDILVDLAGHTAGNRLLAFALKPAPIQLSYLGYPTCTGLSAIDYRITDEQVDPAGYEAFNTGRLLRMPESYYCYRPMANVPDVAPLPAAATGAVTFGSFNNLAKVSGEVLALWARVLQAVPGSRLLLKAKSLADPAVEDRMRQRLGLLGITADRLLLRGWEPTPGGHLPLYAQVDIGLDTFPYNGGTTTCEALWMGVPVISLCGATHASRMGRSLLTAAGYPALVADDPEQFVRIASELAEDLESLSAMRASLRDRMRGSALMDEVRFTGLLEAHYRRIWQQWCREAAADPGRRHGTSAAFERAAEFDESFENLVNLGAAVREAGEPERALHILGRALALRPDSELVYNNSVWRYATWDATPKPRNLSIARASWHQQTRRHGTIWGSACRRWETSGRRRFALSARRRSRRTGWSRWSISPIFARSKGSSSKPPSCCVRRPEGILPLPKFTATSRCS
jgi:protein O-GlcNAc transferase